MRTLYLLSVWLHVLSAAVWIGGMLFLALVLVPVARRPEHLRLAASLFHSTGVRFRAVGWAALALLVATGAHQLAFRGFGWADVASGRIFAGPFGRTLAVKLALVAAVLALSTVHDFLLGPRATALWKADPASPTAARLRRRASWMGRLTLLLALGIVALGVMLVRGTP